MDIFEGQGCTKTILINFQNERLLIYFMIFLVVLYHAGLGLKDLKIKKQFSLEYNAWANRIIH